MTGGRIEVEQQGESAFDATFDTRTDQIGAVGKPDMVTTALKIAKAIDVPVMGEENPVRFYKLTNATSLDVLETIQS